MKAINLQTYDYPVYFTNSIPEGYALVHPTENISNSTNELAPIYDSTSGKWYENWPSPLTLYNFTTISSPPEGLPTITPQEHIIE